MASNEEEVPVLKISVDNTDDFNDNLDLTEDHDEDMIDLEDGEDENKSRSAADTKDKPLEVDSFQPTLDQKVRLAISVCCQ